MMTVKQPGHSREFGVVPNLEDSQDPAVSSQATHGAVGLNFVRLQKVCDRVFGGYPCPRVQISPKEDDVVVAYAKVPGKLPHTMDATRPPDCQELDLTDCSLRSEE